MLGCNQEDCETGSLHSSILNINEEYGADSVNDALELEGCFFEYEDIVPSDRMKEIIFKIRDIYEAGYEQDQKRENDIKVSRYELKRRSDALIDDIFPDDEISDY